MKFDPYALDGDGMAYMDIADLIRAHHWAGVVNAYWHPLYPCSSPSRKPSSTPRAPTSSTLP